MHVEQRRQLARDGLAVVDRHGTVGALGHDLERFALAPHNLNAHKTISESGKHRPGEFGIAGGEPCLVNEAFRRNAFTLRLHRHVDPKSNHAKATPKQKERTREGPTP